MQTVLNKNRSFNKNWYISSHLQHFNQFAISWVMAEVVSIENDNAINYLTIKSVFLRNGLNGNIGAISTIHSGLFNLKYQKQHTYCVRINGYWLFSGLLSLYLLIRPITLFVCINLRWCSLIASVYEELLFISLLICRLYAGLM